ncbi:hypothetical protein [Pseudonocardia sp.]|uniref:DUF7282 domain-containing protein n=1 Tax=Pseudonocardia sp. TaxID=60912 RepID=UPI002608AAA1|nr:hypothetical protein [Pseudonocardia sp.]
MNKTTTFLALAATTAVLTACGSGTDTSAAPVAPVTAAQAPTATTAASPTATTAASPSAAPTAAPVAPVSDPGAEVDADDQSGDGTTAVIREARITVGPGWLAVRSDDDNGGRLLGSAAVAPGQTGPVTVTLTEPVPSGDDDDLTVVLHTDDGDGVFDERLDPRVLDDDDDDQDDDDIEDDDFDYRLN